MEDKQTLFEINTAIIELMSQKDRHLKLAHDFSFFAGLTRQVRFHQNEAEYLQNRIDKLTEQKFKILNQSQKQFLSLEEVNG
ncbi:hypothetical protein [Commensalibacter communis]|uniref:Uncharacterized protein n=1 Tax=Commensalibacter communis TaxID=2972786 RepID=A0A9W4TR22_9PROT|nr:hypothetical protein [Commensalibacter communis]CAI3933933.1 unnamed protein product [Commensalibacter communis]CAI3942254.1 unnamed protein product [Commensalibacter communis]CAI3944277.1 unnamed protein product [Commensalibacter communis]CAI3944411.1 unnamed protein product [Commensalibacter communis]CAI3960385.1 unnamed protein product [Commensalibacter communis]